MMWTPGNWFIMSRLKINCVKQNILESFDKVTAFRSLFLQVEVAIVAVHNLFYVEAWKSFCLFLLSWAICSRLFLVKLNIGSSVSRIP